MWQPYRVSLLKIIFFFWSSLITFSMQENQRYKTSTLSIIKRSYFSLIMHNLIFINDALWKAQLKQSLNSILLADGNIGSSQYFTIWLTLKIFFFLLNSLSINWRLKSDGNIKNNKMLSLVVHKLYDCIVRIADK